MYVVPVTVSIPAGESPIGDVAKYQATPAALSDGDRGPILIDEYGRVYVIVYGSAEVDHTKIKGTALKDPTVAQAIPISIENDAIAYDAVDDVFKVELFVGDTAIDPRTMRALTSSDIVTVVQATAANLKATVTQASADRTISSFPEIGTVTHISETSTADVVTCETGHTLKVHGFFFYSSADITVELRFKGSGNVIGGLTVKGAVGMNLVGKKCPEGANAEDIEIYLSGAGTVKGWINTEET